MQDVQLSNALSFQKYAYVKEEAASEFTGLTRAWLRRARVYGGGPPFTKVNRTVRYKLSDLEAFMDSRKLNNTSQQPTE